MGACRPAGASWHVVRATAACLLAPTALQLVSSSPAAPAVQAESCEGMGEEETRAYVADLVSQQLGVPGFHLDPQQVPGAAP